MKIGIDGRLYRQTGVGRYIRNIVYHLGKIDEKNEYVLYLNRDDYQTVELPNENWTKKLADVPWHTVSEQIKFPQLLYEDKLDVAHFTYFNVPIFYRQKFLLTIHDLIHDHFDTGRASQLPYIFYKIKRLGYKQAINSGIKRAARTTAISETTKQEIVSHYGVPPEEITVTYDALDSRFKKKASKIKPKNYWDFSYMLYVGNAYPHKNLNRLIAAFGKVKKKHRLVKLVLAGDDDYFYPRFRKFVSRQGLSSEVVFFSEANDEQLVNLYSWAKCLVFPSLMEGFGLPNLEALYLNCLPVVSRIPAFSEIWQEKLPYFDPEDVSDMAEKIMDVLSLPATDYKKKVKQAKKRIKDFSWEKTARKTLKLYEEIHRS